MTDKSWNCSNHSSGKRHVPMQARANTGEDDCY